MPEVSVLILSLRPSRINTHSILLISQSTLTGILCPWIVIRKALLLLLGFDTIWNTP
jgi:hypothetical protein